MKNAIHSKKSGYKKLGNSKPSIIFAEENTSGGPAVRTNPGSLVDSICRMWEARRFCGSGTLDKMDRYRLLM